MTVLAHGVRSRIDLPIPLGLALYGAGAAILLSFAVLLLFWRTPRLDVPSSGVPLPTDLQQAVDRGATRRALQAVALAVTVLVLDGQTTWILSSNPFGAAGVDLFGTYCNVVDLRAVGSDAIALVQVGGIVTGHVLGVTLAHERALLSARRARASDQLPLVIVMVLFTLGGLGLLFGF
jgi:hypothetical protein